MFVRSTLAVTASTATLIASPLIAEATDMDHMWQSGADIWEFAPLIPDPAPLAIIGIGLLAMGFIRFFRSAD